MITINTLNKLAKHIHSNSVAKGFYEDYPQIGTKLMLVVSELSEALEADRKCNRADFSAFDNNINVGESFEEAFNQTIKDTFEDEIADAIIRLLDLCAFQDIDIEKHIELKIKYNYLRPYKHGKEY